MLVLVPVLLLVLVKVLALPAVGVLVAEVLVVELLVLLRSIVEGLYHGGASTVDTGPKIKNINKSMHIRVYIYTEYIICIVYIYIYAIARVTAVIPGRIRFFVTV